jgi:hypothetical protein
MQRALLRFFEPENSFEVRKALVEAGRADLIGGCEGLIPAQPPKEALRARMRRADDAVRGEYVHKIPSEGKSKKKQGGYRPGRKTASRQPKRR